MANYPYTNYYQQMPLSAPQPMQQTVQMQPMQQPGFTVRGVTSKEEALAAQADYMTAGHVMPDLAHGIVYVKRPNMLTGACDLLTFKLVTPEEEQPAQYVTMDEFNRFRNEMRNYYESNAVNRPTQQRREPVSNYPADGTAKPANANGYEYDQRQEPRRTPPDGNEYMPGARNYT